MKFWSTILLALAAIVVTVLLVWSATPQPQSLDYYFIVNDSVGIDVQTDILRLGSVPPGGASNRDITVSHPEASIVRIGVRGEGAEYIRVSENPVNISNGSKTVKIHLTIPVNTTEGEYRGSLLFIPVR